MSCERHELPDGVLCPSCAYEDWDEAMQAIAQAAIQREQLIEQLRAERDAAIRKVSEMMERQAETNRALTEFVLQSARGELSRSDLPTTTKGHCMVCMRLSAALLDGLCSTCINKRKMGGVGP